MARDFVTAAIHGGYGRAANGEAAHPPIYARAASDMVRDATGDGMGGGEVEGF